MYKITVDVTGSHRGELLNKLRNIGRLINQGYLEGEGWKIEEAEGEGYSPEQAKHDEEEHVDDAQSTGTPPAGAPVSTTDAAPAASTGDDSNKA